MTTPPKPRSPRAMRTISEAMGMMRGILADGTINQAEAEFLQRWLVATADTKSDPIFDRLQRLLTASLLSHDAFQEHENAILLELLAISGGNEITASPNTSLPSTTFFTSPPPPVDHNARFVFTGRFAYGKRKDVATKVIEHGGSCDWEWPDAMPIRNTEDWKPSNKRYLIVGSNSSNEWATPAFGRKIEAFVRDSSRDPNAYIISEQHWIDSLR